MRKKYSILAFIILIVSSIGVWNFLNAQRETKIIESYVEDLKLAGPEFYKKLHYLTVNRHQFARVYPREMERYTNFLNLTEIATLNCEWNSALAFSTEASKIFPNKTEAYQYISQIAYETHSTKAYEMLAPFKDFAANDAANTELKIAFGYSNEVKPLLLREILAFDSKVINDNPMADFSGKCKLLGATILLSHAGELDTASIKMLEHILRINVKCVELSDFDYVDAYNMMKVCQYLVQSGKLSDHELFEIKSYGKIYLNYTRNILITEEGILKISESYFK